MEVMVRRAGDVVGTSDWQLNRMFESESEKQWEKLNTPTDGETLRQGAKSLGYAINELDEACDCVNEAAENLNDTPEGDKVRSILDEMESILKEMKAMQEMWRAV